MLDRMPIVLDPHSAFVRYLLPVYRMLLSVAAALSLINLLPGLAGTPKDPGTTDDQVPAPNGSSSPLRNTIHD